MWLPAAVFAWIEASGHAYKWIWVGLHAAPGTASSPPECHAVNGCTETNKTNFVWGQGPDAQSLRRIKGGTHPRTKPRRIAQLAGTPVVDGRVVALEQVYGSVFAGASRSGWADEGAGAKYKRCLCEYCAFFGDNFKTR